MFSPRAAAINTVTVDTGTSDGVPRNGIRASLTSLQKRIMNQLKDRPPRYETRHNYQYNQRETSENVEGQSPGPMPNQPPPIYDGTAVRVFQ